MKRYWNSFLHWRGWKACGVFCVKAWKKTIAWPGWKKLFVISPLRILLLSAICTVALVYIFLYHREQTAFAFAVYPLSAYTFVCLCVRAPNMVRRIKAWTTGNSRMQKFRGDTEKSFRHSLYRGQVINFGYGTYKIISGVVYGSAWIGGDGIYHVMQGVIQLYQILRRRKTMSMVEQWKSYRLCGFLILLLHLTMTGLVFQMVNLGRAADHPGFMIFATAAFTFYKITSAFVKVAKDRKHDYPVDSSVRMLKLSQAIFAMFSLQVSLLHVFGTGERWEFWLNAASGCTACFLVVSMGIYMIWRGSRDMKKCQEIPYE